MEGPLWPRDASLRARNPLPDKLQRHVASLPELDRPEYITLVSESTQPLRDVIVRDNPSPDDAPFGHVFEHGFLEFIIDDVPTLTATTLTIFLHGGTQATTYYKFGPTPTDATPHWYEFLYDGTTGAEILSDRIILHFVDGFRGDDDLMENGQIVDIGAPGFTSIGTISSRPSTRWLC